MDTVVTRFGRWEVETLSDGTHAILVRDDEMATGWATICETFTMPNGSQSDNAKLIAEAPRMYSFLVYILNRLVKDEDSIQYVKDIARDIIEDIGV